jgi:hypothetical protein
MVRCSRANAQVQLQGNHISAPREARRNPQLPCQLQRLLGSPVELRPALVRSGKVAHEAQTFSNVDTVGGLVAKKIELSQSFGDQIFVGRNTR